MESAAYYPWIISLPKELLLEIISNLSLTCFYRLRRSSKHLISALDPIPTLKFSAYLKSVEQIGHRLINSQHRMKLDSTTICDEVFLFLAGQNHVIEFLRCLDQRKGRYISDRGKQDAFNTIIRRNGDSQMIIRLLKCSRIDPCQDIMYSTSRNQTKGYYGKIIHWASVKGDSSLINYLYGYPRIDLRALDSLQDEAIHVLAFHGHLNVLKEILQNVRINPKALGYNGQMVLHAAVYGRSAETLKYLLELQIFDMLFTDCNGHNILHISAQEGFSDVLEVIFDYCKLYFTRPSFFNSFDLDGERPIVKFITNLQHLATYQEHSEIISMMLQNSSLDPTLLNTDGDQALDIAAQNGFVNIIPLLLEDLRIDLAAREEALEWAKRMNQLEAAELIIDNIDLNF
jgi:ankyrin repeat protein